MSAPSLYRNIHVSMWGDEKFRSLPDDGKMLWMYLLTCPQTTSVPGCIGVGKASLAEDLDWGEARLLDAFGKLEERGMAKADWRARLVVLPNAFKYATPDSWKNVKGWLKYIAALPECPLKMEGLGILWRHLQARGESVSAPFLAEFGEAHLAACAAAAEGASHGPSDARTEGPSGGPSRGAPDGPSKGHSHAPPYAGSGKDQEKDQEKGRARAPKAAGAAPLAPRSPGPTLEQLRQIWNERMPHPPFPKWMIVGEDQKRAAKRVAETPVDGEDGWLAVLERIARSPFCRGHNDRGTAATPEFLLRVGTPRKVLQGNFDAKWPNGQPMRVVGGIPPSPPDPVDRAPRQGDLDVRRCGGCLTLRPHRWDGEGWVVAYHERCPSPASTSPEAQDVAEAYAASEARVASELATGAAP